MSGSGITVAVLDTGLRSTHVDFAGRVVPGRNFTSDYGGDPSEVTDGHGHGTSVAGDRLRRADPHRDRTERADRAREGPVERRHGRFADIRDALDWLLDRRSMLGISALCLATGAADNRTTDTDMPGTRSGRCCRS